MLSRSPPLDKSCFSPFLLRSSTTSLVISTLSKIHLPFRKANWLSSITAGSTFFNLPAKTFDMILYKTPTSEMGLYYSSLKGSLTLGIKAMNEALQPFGIDPVI